MSTGEPSSSSATFQVLALDGGGIRGLYSAAVLAALEQQLGRPVANYFDLIAGTSTGGLIALALGAGLSPREIVEFYVEEGPAIFKNPLGVRSVAQIFRRKYPDSPREKAFRRIFRNVVMLDSRKRLLVPSYDLDSGRPHIFKTRHHADLVTDWNVPMWEAAMATSAAPTFFPMHRLGGRQTRLVDGGVWANNPVALAIAEARSVLELSLDDVRVFSLGTTRTVADNPRRLNRGGIVQWLLGKKLIDVLMSAQSTGAHGLAQHLIGHERVLRLDTYVPPQFRRLDQTDPQFLLGLAAGDARNISRDFVALLGGHTAPAFTSVPPP